MNDKENAIEAEIVNIPLGRKIDVEEAGAHDVIAPAETVPREDRIEAIGRDQETRKQKREKKGKETVSQTEGHRMTAMTLTNIEAAHQGVLLTLKTERGGARSRSVVLREVRSTGSPDENNCGLLRNRAMPCLRGEMLEVLH